MRVQAIHQRTRLALSSVVAAVGTLLVTAASAQTLPAVPVSPTPVTKYEYDAEGNPTKTIVAPSTRNYATRHEYDALSRRKNTTDAKNGLTQFGYDLQDQLTSVTDPRQLVTQYEPNGLGDLTKLISPDTGTTNSTSFDAAGNLLTRTDARGVLATHSYDELDRPKQIVYSKTGAASRTISWTYDQTGASFGAGVGRLTTAATPEASTTFRYDAIGRVTQTIQQAKGSSGADTVAVVQYEYDEAGHIKKMTYPSGRVLDITWANGQPQAMSITSGATTKTLVDQITASPFGPVKSWVWKIGATPRAHERVFDTHGRLVRHPLGNLVRDITYDDADRISRYTHYNVATAAAAPASDQVFGYDELDRLTSVTGSSNWSYSYDANGNRTTSGVGPVQRNYTVQATSNRLDALANPARNMVYDAAGNTSSDIQSGSSSNYTATYSLEGRWATMTQGMHVMEFLYDAAGRRVVQRRVVTQVLCGKFCTTQNSYFLNAFYAYDINNHLIGEYDATGTAITEYVWLGDMPIAVIKPDGSGVQTYAVHTDHLDTPRVILDANGEVRWRWVGEPFGASPAEEQPTAGLPALRQNLRFPGQQYEAFGGRHYNHFRDYDPSTGRYVQSDPIGLRGGLNTYSYVQAEPTAGIDPSGLSRNRIVLPSGTQTIESIRSYPEVVRLESLIREVQPTFSYSTISSNGTNVFGYRDVQHLNSYYGSLAGPQNAGRCAPSYQSYISWARREGVARAWEDELALVLRTGQGSRPWTRQEMRELLQNGRVTGYVGHHSNSVAASPGLASNPNNVRFTTPYSHFWTEHNGNYQTPTFGPLIQR